MRPPGLLECCERVHMALNGSGDPLSEGETVTALLRTRLAEWKPSLPGSEPYDEAVRALIRATLAEVDRERHGTP